MHRSLCLISQIVFLPTFLLIDTGYHRFVLADTRTDARYMAQSRAISKVRRIMTRVKSVPLRGLWARGLASNMKNRVMAAKAVLY